MNACAVGVRAPDFSVDTVALPGPDASPQFHRTELAQYRGRWLALVFYPRDFSFVCPTELSDLSAKLDSFRERNCDVLAISPDTIQLHQEWLSTAATEGGVQGLRYPLGADGDGVVAKAYGVWRAELELPSRGLFLIDPQGVLRYSVVHDLAVGRNAAEVLRILDALRSGGLCPANWTGTDGILDVEAMLAPGRVLGHYRIVREIGRGAFGLVLAADDLRLGRRVALKIFQHQSSESEAKLISEARSAASVEQENVCKIYSIDELDGMLVIVMEYIDGGALSDLVRVGVDGETATRMTGRIAAGLRAAHAKGVIHGDLKPANILLRDSGTPVIVDFGLAKTRGNSATSRQEQVESRESAEMPPDPELERLSIAETADGIPAASKIEFDSTVSQVISPNDSGRTISGTPAYMSPEQARGETLSEASDVFSLGMIVTEMLTGRHPLRTESPIAIINRLQNPREIESIASKVPDEHREHVSSMLAPFPGDRPGAQEIEQWFA